VGEGEQSEVAALAVVGSSVDMGSLPPLDHGHDGFDLGASLVGGAIEALFHESPIASLGKLVGRSTMLGGNHGPNAVFLAGEAVIGSGVVAGVGRQLRKFDDPQRLGEQGTELVDVGPRPSADARGEDEVIVAVADDSQLGKR